MWYYTGVGNPRHLGGPNSLETSCLIENGQAIGYATLKHPKMTTNNMIALCVNVDDLRTLNY